MAEGPQDLPLDALIRLQEGLLALLDPERSLAGAITALLELASGHLGVEAAWFGECTDTADVVRAAVGARGPLGAGMEGVALAGRPLLRLCRGELPLLDGAVAGAPFGAERPVGAYVAAPIVRQDGTAFGALIALAAGPRPRLGTREQALLQVIARVVGGRLDADPGPAEVRRPGAGQIRQVLSAGGPTMVLQPIVALETGDPVGFEALARFPAFPGKPTLRWFEEAAEAGLGPALETAALQAGLARLPALPDHTYLSLNVSPTTLVAVEAAGVFTDPPGDRLVIEITEHAPVSDYAAVGRSAHRLRAAGIRLAIDDAGAGFASMRHVVNLRPELIKLDLGLIRGIDRDPLRQALTASLVAFATATGSDLVAEGIETWGELATLWELGVPYGQGFLLGQPGHDPQVRVGSWGPRRLPPPDGS